MTSILSSWDTLGGVQLGDIEIKCLARLGFQHLSSETVPLWHWYSTLSNSRLQVALSVNRLIGVNDNEKIGAISVLDALALEIPTNDGSIERDWILDFLVLRRFIGKRKTCCSSLSREEWDS